MVERTDEYLHGTIQWRIENRVATKGFFMQGKMYNSTAIKLSQPLNNPMAKCHYWPGQG
jgi:hypothetical protein